MLRELAFGVYRTPDERRDIRLLEHLLPGTLLRTMIYQSFHWFSFPLVFI